jgi:hypothetical protein
MQMCVSGSTLFGDVELHLLSTRILLVGVVETISPGADAKMGSTNATQTEFCHVGASCLHPAEVDQQQCLQASLTLAKAFGLVAAADMGLSLLLLVVPQGTTEVVPLRGLLSDARLLLAMLLLAHVCDRGMPSVFACMLPLMGIHCTGALLRYEPALGILMEDGDASELPKPAMAQCMKKMQHTSLGSINDEAPL